MRDCPHAHTTTVAWLYGEAPDEHAMHVAACPACTQTLQSHELVLGALAPVAVQHPVSRPVSRRVAPWLVALAAAGVGWMMWGAGSQGLQAEDAAWPRVADAPSAISTTDIDQEIDALSLAIDDLSEDFSTL
jgi:hypothetical protein